MGDSNQTAPANQTVPPMQDSGGTLADVLADAGNVAAGLLWFVLVLIIGWGLGRGLRAVYDRTRRGKLPTSRQLLIGKSIVLASVFVVTAVSLSAAGVDLVTLLTTLGIVSVALGFGLQNTVANLAAGFALSLDRPFDVGDRINVGQTWGDVESVGLRSTRIVTVNGEHVSIPNAILDTQEVWNSTLDDRAHLRLDLPVGISYMSSLPLAESLLLKVARRSDRILSYPDPVVRARRFGDNSIDLELRVWLKRATQRPAVIDEMVRGIKEAFDEEGVHFPFPQRTISYLTEEEPPAPTPDYLKGGAASRPTLLVCTRSPQSARVAAHPVVHFAHELDARLVVLNVRPQHQALEDQRAQEAVNTYLAEAEAQGVPAKGRTEVGDLSDQVVAAAREEGARLVLFGVNRRSSFGNRWLRKEIDETVRACPMPVLEIDVEQVQNEQFINEWYAELHPPEEDDPAEDKAPIPEPVEEPSEDLDADEVAHEPDASDESKPAD